MEIKPKEEGELVFNDGFYVNLCLVSPSPYGVIDKKNKSIEDGWPERMVLKEQCDNAQKNTLNMLTWNPAEVFTVEESTPGLRRI